jgi:hypothetical protein
MPRVRVGTDDAAEGADLMSDSVTIRDKVLAAVHDGTLPDCSPQRTWGGQGSGASCAICGELISRDEVEFELEFARGSGGSGPGSGPDNYRVHFGCFSLWETERRKLELARARLSDAGAGTRVPPHEREALREPS